MQIVVPVSWGELLDKIAILEIKAERISDPARLGNVQKELAELVAVRDGSGIALDGIAADIAALKQVNEALWQIEDDIRDCERRQDFGPDFIRLARAVYHSNDRRAAVKKAINLALGSELVEEKSYTDYKAGLSQG